MNSKYWTELEARLYAAANHAGADPDKAGAIIDKRLGKLYDAYELQAQALIAKGYTRVPDPDNQDFPDWFIAPNSKMNNLVITSIGNGSYLPVTSGPLPEYIC